jgi:myosin heavy subunit
MVAMPVLNEPELIKNIEKRFLNRQIFTFVGSSLVVVNPYTSIEGNFSPKTLMIHQTEITSTSFELNHLSPHIYSVTGFSIWQLKQN